MAVQAFRSPVSLRQEGFSRHSARPAAPPGKETLAILVSSSKLCGIAAYAAALRRQLDDAFDITIVPLDQYLLRSQHRRVKKLGDRHIKEVCQAIRGFDAVSLQLEYGTLGRSGSDILRRFCWLTDAAPRLSITFHSLLRPPSFDVAGMIKALVTLQFKTAVRIRNEFRRAHLLTYGIARQLRRLQGHKQVSVIVHNRRDLRDIRYLYGIRHIFDHPLAFLSGADAEAVRSTASRQCFPMLDHLSTDAVLVGVFGFLSDYKGFGTAVQALQYLPANYHLLIFGGLHPQSIAPRQVRHPYISSLYSEAFIETTLYERLGDAGGSRNTPQMVVADDQVLRELLGTHPRDLSARIHFMGALGESEFLTGMAICDAVVFPYLEVGQSSSGPISQALELGCRIIASRTHNFLEFAEYHANAIEFFDIGNHLELAARLSARAQFPARTGAPEYNVETNKAIYLLANSRIRPDRWGTRGPIAVAQPVASPSL